MSGQRDEMELKEEAVKAHYAGAAALLSGFDHAPRIGKAQVVETPAERSPGIGTRPRFRSTTPGLVTRSTARPEGVRLIERVEGIGGDDPIVDPVEAVVLQALRRALAIALAVGEMFSGQTGLTELKKANLESRLPEARRSEFSELLAAEALAVYLAARPTPDRPDRLGLRRGRAEAVPTLIRHLTAHRCDVPDQGLT